MNFSQIEIEKLQTLAENEVLLGVLYKLFFQVADSYKPEVNNTDTNALLGEKYRASELSKQIINAGFTALQSYKTIKADKKQLNRAR